MVERSEHSLADHQHLLSYVRGLKKPLIFVAMNDFANLSTVKDLDKTLLTLFDRALELAFKPEQVELLGELRVRFKHFEAADEDAKRKTIAESLKSLRSLERRLVHVSGGAAGGHVGRIRAARTGAGLSGEKERADGGRRSRKSSGGRQLRDAKNSSSSEKRDSSLSEVPESDGKPENGHPQKGRRRSQVSARSRADRGGPSREEASAREERGESGRASGKKAGGRGERESSRRRKERRDSRSRNRRIAPGQTGTLRADRKGGRGARKSSDGSASGAAYWERHDQDLDWGRARKNRIVSFAASLPAVSGQDKVALENGKHCEDESDTEVETARVDTVSHDTVKLTAGSSDLSTTASCEASTVAQEGASLPAHPEFSTRTAVSDAAEGDGTEEVRSGAMETSEPGRDSDAEEPQAAEVRSGAIETSEPGRGSDAEEPQAAEVRSGAIETSEPETEGEAEEPQAAKELRSSAALEEGVTSEGEPEADSSFQLDSEQERFSLSPPLSEGVEYPTISSPPVRDSESAEPNKSEAVTAEEVRLPTEDVVASPLESESLKSESFAGGVAEKSPVPSEAISSSSEPFEIAMSSESGAASPDGEAITRSVSDPEGGEASLDAALDGGSALSDLATLTLEASLEDSEEGSPTEGGASSSTATSSDDTEGMQEALAEGESPRDLGTKAEDEVYSLDLDLSDAEERRDILEDDLTIDEFMWALTESVTGPDESIAPEQSAAREEAREEGKDAAEEKDSEKPSDSSGRFSRRKGRRRRTLQEDSVEVAPEPETRNEIDLEKVEGDAAFLRRRLETLKGVGPKLSVILDQRGLQTLEDCIRYLPQSYLDRRTLSKIVDLRDGHFATIVCSVEAADIEIRGRTRDLTVRLSDETGQIQARWEAVRSNYLRNRFKVGNTILVWGTVTCIEENLVLVAPETEQLPADLESDEAGLNRIVPVYPSIEGVGQKMLRRIIRQVLAEVEGRIFDPVPCQVRRRQRLLPLSDALKAVHAPDNSTDMQQLLERRTPAQRTLSFHDFFTLEFLLAQRRKALANCAGLPMKVLHGYVAKVLERMPKLGEAQRVAFEEIKRDMRAPHAMVRILQADVGAGALEVAALAIAMALDNGTQVAVIATTEALVGYYARFLRRLFGPLHVELETFMSSLRGRGRDRLIHRMRKGEIPLIVGTHALFQDGITFRRLGLAVVDDGCRGGLLQRGHLLRKGANPDVLLVTGAPVPENILKTVYGDLTWSILSKRLPEACKVRTTLVTLENRTEIEQAIRDRLAEGRQVFYVSPVGYDRENSSIQRLVDIANRLNNEVFPGIEVTYVHHRMKVAHLEEAYQKFERRECQILVCNEEIRIAGAPRASTMIIERADELPLLQLHGLRGGLLRSDYSARCYLVPGPRAEEAHLEGLRKLEQCDDGFELTEFDFSRRGASGYLGVRQAGLVGFWAGSLEQDKEALAAARQEAFRWVDGSPESADQVASQFLNGYARMRWPELQTTIQGQ